jgi:hypothetical protein
MKTPVSSAAGARTRLAWIAGAALTLAACTGPGLEPPDRPGLEPPAPGKTSDAGAQHHTGGGDMGPSSGTGGSKGSTSSGGSGSSGTSGNNSGAGGENTPPTNKDAGMQPDAGDEDAG